MKRILFALLLTPAFAWAQVPYDPTLPYTDVNISVGTTAVQILTAVPLGHPRRASLAWLNLRTNSGNVLCPKDGSVPTSATPTNGSAGTSYAPGDSEEFLGSLQVVPQTAIWCIATAAGTVVNVTATGGQ